MEFSFYPKNQQLQPNRTYLFIDNWDDYTFKTMFYLTVVGKDGGEHSIGNVKIGYRGQATGSRTSEKMPQQFTNLTDEFFSLGDKEFYRNIVELPANIRTEVLTGLNDLVYFPEKIESIRDEDVLITSLLRNMSLASIKGQFSRILKGQAELTDYDFYFENKEFYQSFKFEFHVKKESTPSTNIHALIGRNGSGKTTLLNKMIDSMTNKSSKSRFLEKCPSWLSDDEFIEIKEGFFSRLVSVSFSAFDPFIPPDTKRNMTINTGYSYIGLKKPAGKLKERDDLFEDFQSAINLLNADKTHAWLRAVETLESDDNFADMQLSKIVDSIDKDEIQKNGLESIKEMSTGHAIVLLTITELIAKVEEKTLVLIDEPESHLHPPLLSAFLRALSDLLIDRNGVAIIATHSPVVLQEIPSSCVYKIKRNEFSKNITRPKIETFGENVGILTRDVFGLEVNRSGFYELLERDVNAGMLLKDILKKYETREGLEKKVQLGLEARTHLLSLIAQRDNQQSND